MSAIAAENARLAALADQCVMCGLCLPWCPTYAAGREEGESPRGRIALIKGLAEGRMTATPQLVAHLDSCLACRRCEVVCPADVRYGELIAGARALPALSSRRPRWLRMLDRALIRPLRLRALMAWRPALRIARPWSRHGNGPWARRLRALDALPAPAPPSPSRPAPAAHTEAAAAIVIFRGCVPGRYETELRADARRLLAALGESDIGESAPDLCCGSLARFGGDAAEAARLESRLLERLATQGMARVVLSTATGCHGRLADLLAPIGMKVRTLHDYLAEHPKLNALRFAALGQRVAVHRPCTQRRRDANGNDDAIERLLSRIPGLEQVALPEQDRCCGAAGSHFLAQPAQSETLRARVLDDINAAAPGIIVSSNIGCRLFLDAGLTENRRKIPILHPVELLARQLIP
jgi:glycolate oxidase iron-sulfur subunit